MDKPLSMRPAAAALGKKLWLLLCVLATVACGASERAPTGGPVFRYRLGADPPTLDPALSTDTTSGVLVLNLFDGLVELDPETLKVRPAIASAWEVTGDGLNYTFHLRTDARFHHGRPITAADFIRSFERVLDPKTRSPRRWVLEPILGARAFAEGLADSIVGLRAPDPKTLGIRLKRPFAPFLAQLCMEAASAVPVEIAERLGPDFASQPTGSGPFRFVAWKHDVSVTIGAFGDYYTGAPEVGQVRFEVVPDVNVALQKYEADELDLLDQLPEGRLEELRARHPDEVKVWPTLSVYYYGFNHAKPPFANDRALRQAINHAIDRERIARVLREGKATPARGILPPGIPGHNTSLEGYPFDLDRARRLLVEAGYPGGRGLGGIDLWYNTNERHERIAQVVQSSLAQIGVETRLRRMDWASYLEACERGEPLLFRMGWVADYPDADNFLYTLLHSSQAGAPGNFSRFSHPILDRLLDEARLATDPGRRRALYMRTDSLATAEAAWTTIYYDSAEMLIRPVWEGVVLPAQGTFALPLGRLRRKLETG